MPDTDMHLSDELLSAALDGELTSAEQAEVDAHLPSCAQCIDRFDAFRTVAGAVAAFDPGALVAIPVAAETGPDAVVVPFERRRRPVPPLAWLAAAAAAVMLLAGVAALVRTSDNGGEMAAVTSDESAETAGRDHQLAQKDSEFSSGVSAGAATAAGAGVPEPIDGGDLGERSEPEEIAGLVRTALDSPARTAAPLAATAVDAAEQGPTPPASVATTAPPPERPCVDEARAAAGEQLGLLRYAAVLRYRGTPAVLLAFDRNDGARQAFVMAQANCAVLAEPQL